MEPGAFRDCLIFFSPRIAMNIKAKEINR